MRNSDMPAMPSEFKYHNMQSQRDVHEMNTGLTKREHFAAMAMQGLCNAADNDGTWSHDPDIVAPVAVKYADALLAALEEK
jgi:hypothetical protein